MNKFLLITIAAVVLVGCGESKPEYSGSYSLTIGGTSIRFQLKSDGTFIGSPEDVPEGVNDDAVGTWKVEGDLLVCEGTITENPRQITVKFDKTTFKLISLAENGQEAPLNNIIPEGENGIYLRKLQQSVPTLEAEPSEPVAEAKKTEPQTAKATDVSIHKAAIDSALLEATLIGDINNVKKALNSGANINAQDDIDFTPLQYSARGGHYEIVKLLLEKGASINIKDTIGELPIHKIENLKVTQILIEKGSDVNAKNNQLQTPLDNAIKFQKHKTIKLLRKHGGKMSEELDAAEQGSKADAPDITIHEAAGDGNIEVVIQHLDAGTDVNAEQGIPEWTPLHLASQFNRKEVAELLIRKGADMNAKDQDGKTPLDWAIMRKHTETAALLRKHGGKTGEELKAEGK